MEIAWGEVWRIWRGHQHHTEISRQHVAEHCEKILRRNFPWCLFRIDLLVGAVLHNNMLQLLVSQKPFENSKKWCTRPSLLTRKPLPF